MHIICLFFNWVMVVLVLRLPPPEAVPTILMSSQKSAPVAVTVISYLTPSLSQQGLLAIPCVMGQLLQVFLDSLLANRMGRWVDAYEKKKEEEEQQLSLSPWSPSTSSTTAAGRLAVVVDLPYVVEAKYGEEVH